MLIQRFFGIYALLCRPLFDDEGCARVMGEESCNTWNVVTYQCVNPTLPLDEYSKNQMARLIRAAKEFPEDLLIKRRFQGEKNLSERNITNNKFVRTRFLY